ncbi:MAG: hypothetical protein WAQ08_02065 [Aquabacterium sp.]|jgi:hypothetical protein|uniref:hypothetical protein n=1 Tax=Aquabacterium sp. TaxID=1872578 RepID=UPI003BAF0BA8
MATTDFLVIHITADHAETPIGEVRIDDAGTLTLLSASPEQTEYLEDWVKRLNEREGFVLKVPPPAEANVPMLSVYGRKFSRTDPTFIADLKAYVKQLYGIKLLTQAELTQELDDLGKQGL